MNPWIAPVPEPQAEARNFVVPEQVIALAVGQLKRTNPFSSQFH
jgi:hypothetical protein